MSKDFDDMSDNEQFFFITKRVCAWLAGVSILLLAGCPQYGVWQQSLSGKAELARANANRQIAVAEAEAKREAAKSLAHAEIERAKGVAEANRIIGESLKGNEDYLRYLWIDGLQNKGNEVIYIPTEAGIPILEAGKRKAQP